MKATFRMLSLVFLLPVHIYQNYMFNRKYDKLYRDMYIQGIKNFNNSSEVRLKLTKDMVSLPNNKCYVKEKSYS